MKNSILAVMIFGVVIAAGSTSWACSLAGYQELMLDESLPGIVWTDFSFNVESIKRGANSGSSCDDLGWVVLKVTNGPAGAGYAFQVVDGNSPKNFSEREAPILPEDNRVTLVWSEDMSDDQPPLNFTLRITPYAPNGEVGEYQDVVITHQGVDGGCSATGSNNFSLFSLLLFGGLFVATRRQNLRGSRK